MTKEQILKKLELYQEKSTSMEAAMSFGVSIKLVEKLDAAQEQEEPAKDWEPKEGDWICVRDSYMEGWITRQFVRYLPGSNRVVCLNPQGQEIKWNHFKPLHR
jgi:hypothetical protein